MNEITGSHARFSVSVHSLYKLKRAGSLATLLWMRAIVYCNGQPALDGRVPLDMLLDLLPENQASYDESLPVKSREGRLDRGRQKYTDEPVINILREGEAGARINKLCRWHGVSDDTYHRWKAKYAGLSLSELKRLTSH